MYARMHKRTRSIIICFRAPVQLVERLSEEERRTGRHRSEILRELLARHLRG